jgi:hypothetical protein
MKRNIYIAGTLLLVLPVFAFSQSAEIDAALNRGNAADVGVFFAGKVDVSILNQDHSGSAVEAVRSLADFFSKNTVKSYKRAHLTDPADGRAGYSLGDLSTSTGDYRIYLYYTPDKKISEIRIEK